MTQTQTHTAEAGDVTTLREAERALRAAKEFIANGVELGFIRMPYPDTPDSAHDTPRLIDEALAALARTKTASSSEKDIERAATALLDRRGFGFYSDPMEGGQDAYDLSLEALDEVRAVLSALAASAAPRAPEVPKKLLTIEATQVTLGEGLVDITVIRHDGRAGVLFRPRAEHIPFGEGGELQEGDYWPVPGDVVLWVSGKGPQVAIDALRTLAAAPAAPPADGGTEGQSGTAERLIQRLENACSDRPMFCCGADRDEAVRIAQEEMNFRTALSSRTPAGAAGDTVGLRAIVAAYSRLTMAQAEALAALSPNGSTTIKVDAAMVALRAALAGLPSRTPAGAAGDPVTELVAKAEGQVAYWRERQAAEKCLEDGISDDGETYTPIGDEAAWQGGYCNGRMSEADWWISTLKTLATRPASPAPAASVLKLRPCPFCGGDAVMHPNDIVSGGASMATPGTAQYAHCDGCGAEGPQSLDSEQEAADRWNARAALAPAAQVNPGREEIARIILREMSTKHHLGSLEAANNAADAILAARSVAGGDAGWQPIETAPKDGSWFLSEHGGKVVLASRDEGTAYPWDIARIPISPNTAVLDGELKVWRPLPEPPAARPAPSPAKGGIGA